MQLIATGWLYEADLLCVKPPNYNQMPTGGPLRVIWQPLWSPPCLLLLLGGRLYTSKKCMLGPYKQHQQWYRGPPEASHREKANPPSVTGWHRGGPHGGPLKGLQGLASSEPPDFMLLWFWPPTANLIPPHCFFQKTDSASTLLPLGRYRRQAYSVPSPLMQP